MKLEPIYEFLLWFVLSFVGVLLLNSFVPHKVIFSFIIALAISVLAIRGEE